MTLIFDVAPIGGGLEIFAAVAFLLVFAGIALVVFKLLKKTVKMAVRMTIVGLILTIAVIGSIFFFYSTSPKPRPIARPTPAR